MIAKHEMEAMMRLSRVCVPILVLLMLSSLQSAGQRVLQTVPLQSKPQAHAPLYLDINSKTHYVYATTSESLVVLDGRTKLIVAEVPADNLAGFYDVAVNSVTNTIYATEWFTNAVIVIDGATNTITGHIAVGSPGLNLWNITLNTTTNTIYVSGSVDGVTYQVYAIDGVTNTVISTISVPGRSAGLDTNPSSNRIYVASPSTNLVSVIDGITNVIIATIPIDNNPRSIAANSVTNRIYVATDGSEGQVIDVINGDTNQVIDTVNTGAPNVVSPDIAINNKRNEVYFVVHQGGIQPSGAALGVLDGTDDTILALIPLRGAGNPLGLAADSSTSKVYTADWQGYMPEPSSLGGGCNDSITQVDIVNEVESARVVTATSPYGVAVNTATNRVYVADLDRDLLSVLVEGGNRIAAIIPTGPAPFSVAANKATNRIYVTDFLDNTVTVIDGSTNTRIDTVSGLPEPLSFHTITVNSATNRVYVAGPTSLTVIDGATNEIAKVISGMGGTVTVNSSTNMLYVGPYEASGQISVAVLSGADETLIATIDLEDASIFFQNGSIASNPSTNMIYAAVTRTCELSNVFVLDGKDNKVVASIPMTGKPHDGFQVGALAVDSIANTIYATNTSPIYLPGCTSYRGTNLTAIDGVTNTIAKTVKVGSLPYGIAIDEGSIGGVYVSNVFDGTVSVLSLPKRRQ